MIQDVSIIKGKVKEMKKLVFMFVAFIAMSFMSCGNNAGNNAGNKKAANDSDTIVTVDSVDSIVADSDTIVK